MGYEEKARVNHRNGNNCSVSLFKAFADKLKLLATDLPHTRQAVAQRLSSLPEKLECKSSESV